MREAVVAKLSDPYSAELVVARLKDTGIVARITGRVEPTWAMGSPTAVTPVEVRVAEDKAADARAVLEDAEDEGSDQSGHGALDML